MNIDKLFENIELAVPEEILPTPYDSNDNDSNKQELHTPSNKKQYFVYRYKTDCCSGTIITDTNDTNKVMETLKLKGWVVHELIQL